MTGACYRRVRTSTLHHVQRLTLALIGSGVIVLLAACGGSGGTTPPASPNVSDASPVTAVDRPAGVPTAALAIETTTQLGDIVRSADEPPQGVGTRTLRDASCEDGVLTLMTSEGTIYAALPCDRFWGEEQRRQFVGQEVAIMVEVTAERFRILIETLAGAQAEFTVGGVWLTGP